MRLDRLIVRTERVARMVNFASLLLFAMAIIGFLFALFQMIVAIQDMANAAPH
jgi:hypothetical protein